jgi:Tubulin like
MLANANRQPTANAVAERITRPVLNIFIGTKAALAGQWIAKYELPQLNRADQERVGSYYLDLEPLSAEIDDIHRATSDASPMIKQTLRFPDMSEYVEGLTAEQRNWLQISNPFGKRLPEYTRMGAGGVRQNGHGAIWYNSAIIAQHLEALINNISAVDSAGHAPDADLITINIVCFLGGGTGSGALPAIASLARHVLRAQRRGGNIFVYAMLPVNVGNVAPERQNLQKSNSLAALMELEALMLKGDDKSQAFLLEMGNLQIRIPGGLVDEVFLFDDTQLGDQIEQISQLIGMAIAMRMQNLTGIGKREQAVLPDLTALQEHDDGGLITNVGSVCPLEVVFPASDLAVGFARRRAEAVLRQAMTDEALDYKEVDLLRNQVCPARKAMEAFRLTDRERRAAPEPRRWNPSDIIQSIERYSTVVEQTFNDQKQQTLKDQVSALDALCQNSTWARSLGRLKAALNIFAEEYKKVKELTFATNPTMTRMGPDQLAAENERKRRAYYQQACQDDFQRHRIVATNAVADTMLEEIEKRVRMVDVMLGSLGFTQQRWEADHAESPEMRGMLTQEHPYRHNVFDHSAIPETEAINQLDTAVTDAEADRILKRAMVKMAAALTGDEREARRIASLEAQQIMDDMMDAYHQRLSEMRLLEAIQMAYPREREKQEAALANHLRWMSLTSRSTLRHDPSLWGDQAHRQLEVRAHIAVDYIDERERQWVERARQSVGGFGERGPGYVPPGEVVSSNESARLQLLFSHHGVSLTAIPFLSDAAGGCIKSLKDREQIWETQGGLPVFTCDALQELVLRPGMFFDPAYEKTMRASSVQQGNSEAASGEVMPGSLPIANPVTQPRNLIDRIERRTRN